jgi:hypothetical protein
MTEKTPPAGWVVQVTVPAPFEYYNVAIAAPDTAVEATTKHVAKVEAKDGAMRVVRGLSSGEVAALSLKAGEVRAA